MFVYIRIKARIWIFFLILQLFLSGFKHFQSTRKNKVCIRAKWPIRPELILVSSAWSDWEYFYSPLDGMLVHRRVTPSIKFAGTHLYTWVERDTVRVKCLAQEHNTMSPVRARTRTARSGDERTNHEATAHTHVVYSNQLNSPVQKHLMVSGFTEEELGQPVVPPCILVYCSVTNWTRFCYIIGFEDIRICRPHVIGFVADLLFSTLESGFKTIRIRVDVTYQTRETVFHRNIQTPRRQLKVRCAAEYFLRKSRCSDSRWNTVSRVWYIFSIGIKTE